MKRYDFTRIVVAVTLLLATQPAFAQQPLAKVVSTSAASSTVTDASAVAPDASARKPTPQGAAKQHQLGHLNLTVNWRWRTEAWDWFEPSVPAQDSYAFGHSLLRVGIGQKSERSEWFVEGAQNAIVHLPTAAVPPGAEGQLGSGGPYYPAT